MDRQTLRDCFHRYNAEGIAGLCERARSGRPPQLSQAQLGELARLLEACRKAWNDLIARPERLASITRRNWAKVS